MPQHITFRSLLFLTLAVGFLASCGKKGVINKTKYEGQKVTNTCDQFSSEVSALVEANASASLLRVSEYDNSQFDALYLEPGQFVQYKDTLYFRLINDIEFAKYCQKGVSVHVTGYYTALEHLKGLEKEPSGIIGDPLVINEAYIKPNSTPFFVYKMAVPGKKLDGKQISLTYSIVKYDKKGKLKKVFCNSVNVPLGPMEPGCCTFKPWQETKPKSLVQVPELDINDETYRYKGFKGTLDLIFPMMKATFKDHKFKDPYNNNEEFKNDDIKDIVDQYVSKFRKEGFDVVGISIAGYASQGGKDTLNLRLSQDRAKAVYDELLKYFNNDPNKPQIPIDYVGKGEDWERFKLLVEVAPFDDASLRAEILEVANKPMDVDQKEQMLRELDATAGVMTKKTPRWDELTAKVLQFCRHTEITFTFAYQPDKMYVEEQSTPLTIKSNELYNVATKKFTVSKYQAGLANPQKNLNILNTLIDGNNNKKPNLYAMRSTYHFGMNNVEKAIMDIESAMKIDKGNKAYGVAALAYKTKYVHNYTLAQRMEMLNEYNSMIMENPDDKALYYNRAIMMDNVGFISGALAQYDALMGGGKSTDAIGLNNRGVAKLKTNRLLEAEADFLDAIKADATVAEPYFNLAIIYAYKGLSDKAVANLDKAIELDPSLKAEICGNPAFKVMKMNPKFKKYGC